MLFFCSIRTRYRTVSLSAVGAGCAAAVTVIRYARTISFMYQ